MSASWASDTIGVDGRHGGGGNVISWSGRYQDSHGSESVTIDSDGHQLKVRIRGSTFVGEQLDDLEPLVDDDSPVDPSLFLHDNTLRAFVLEWVMPVPVLVDGSRTEGTLSCRLSLPEPTWPQRGGPDDELTVVMRVGDAEYATGRPYDLFEDALADIQHQLPAGTRLMACLTCAWSDFSAGNVALFGGMACFRDVKEAYREVRTKFGLYDIWAQRTEFVQETHLCDEFEDRPPDTGYRGSFPGPVPYRGTFPGRDRRGNLLASMPLHSPESAS